MDRYIIAIYLRLSVEDKRVESMSIESQRLLLRKYAEALGDNVEIIEYVDNGYSGTNLERPAVQQLLNDVKTYKVNCILGLLSFREEQHRGRIFYTTNIPSVRCAVYIGQR